MTVTDEGLRTDNSGDDAPRLGVVGDETRPKGWEEQQLADDESGEGLADGERAPLAVLPVTISAVLSSAAAAWLLSGAFTGVTPRVLALAAAVFGVLLASVTQRGNRPGGAQFLGLPVILAAGAAAATFIGEKGDGALVDQITDAVRNGGFGQDGAVAFDAGWRFLLTVLAAFLGATAALAAFGLRRAPLAVAVPLPGVVVGVLITPPDGQMVAIVVALALLGVAMAVSSGAEMGQRGVTGGGKFEIRRVLRAAVVAAVLLGALAGVGASGILLPGTKQSEVVPPRKPESSGAKPKDEVLFSVSGAAAGQPLRLGVLDSFTDGWWMLPSQDPSRLKDAAGALEKTDQPLVETKITIDHLDGRQLPVPAGTTEVSGYPGLKYDPKTQQLITDGAPRKGSYTVKAPAAADVPTMEGAPAADAGEFKDYLDAPPVPYAVQDILLKLGDGLSPATKLGLLRKQYYDAAVAGGPGSPVAITPERVVQILDGDPATPFELVAGEALLARWAGVPARIGYGYAGGEKQPDGSINLRPNNGGYWLEAYIPGSGWVPLPGRPAKADSKLDTGKKDAGVKASDQLAAEVYVPIRLEAPQMVYTKVRYWAVRLVPAVLGFALLAFAYPGLVKTARAWRRRRWAKKQGPREQVAVAYAELRDYAIDLNVGQATMTPIEFLDAVQHEEVHSELAWMVTRVLWGDLARGTQEADAVYAKRMAGSIRRRLREGQTFGSKALAYTSRVSLQAPWTDAVPNLWVSIGDGTVVRRVPLRVRFDAAVRRTRMRMRRARWRLWAWFPKPHKPSRTALARFTIRFTVTAVAVAMVVTLIVTGGIKDVDLSVTAADTGRAEQALPAMPDRIDGALGVTVDREPTAETAFSQQAANSLVTSGRYFGVRKQGQLVATVETAVFKPGVVARGNTARDGLLAGLGNGNFELVQLDGLRLQVQSGAEKVVAVWFAADGRSFQIVTAKAGFDAPAMLAALVRFQRTGSTDGQILTGMPPVDHRRGAE